VSNKKFFFMRSLALWYFLSKK